MNIGKVVLSVHLGCYTRLLTRNQKCFFLTGLEAMNSKITALTDSISGEGSLMDSTLLATSCAGRDKGALCSLF